MSAVVGPGCHPAGEAQNRLPGSLGQGEPKRNKQLKLPLNSFSFAMF